MFSIRRVLNIFCKDNTFFPICKVNIAKYKKNKLILHLGDLESDYNK